MPTPTTAQAAALTGSSRVVRFQYDVITAGDYVRSNTLGFTDGTVRDNNLADGPKRTFTGSLLASVADTISFLSDKLRVSMIVTAGGVDYSWTLGTFLMSTSDKVRGSLRGDVPIEGYDLLLVLQEDCITDRYVVAAGSVVTSSVNVQLATAGFASSSVVSSTLTTPAAMEWEPGTSRLRIINDLLAAINYTTLSMTPDGVPVAAPYVDPASAAVVYRYTVDASSVIRPGLTTTLDLFDVPNVFVAYVSEPDRPALRSVYTNSDPTSPTSTVNRGRSIVRVLSNDPNNPDLSVNQATLDAKTAAAAKDALQLLEIVQFDTLLMPFHDTGEVFELNWGDGVSVWREHEWEMPLQVGAAMKHRMRRGVPA